MLLRKKAQFFNKILIAAMLSCLIFAVFFAFMGSDKSGGIGEVTAEIWNGETANSFAGGDGNSATSAYQISNASELARLAYLINNSVNSIYHNAFYKLTADIILNDTDEYAIWGTAFAPVYNWVPIGNGTSVFGGNFDGNGFTIKGMYVNRISADYQGLFGKISGVIKNVGIKESYIAGKNYVGGIAGYCTQKIENCYNEGTVYAAGKNCGGIAGYVGDGGIMEDCFNLGQVSAAGENVGGVLGQLKSVSLTSIINNCYNDGTVSGANSGVGGVVGYNENSKIVNVSNSGPVSGSLMYIGGIAGRSNGLVENTSNTGSVAGTGASADSCKIIGGIVGYNENPGVLKNSFNTGAVTKPTENTTALIGGVVGENSNSTASSIANSYAQRNSISDLALVGAGTSTDTLGFSASGQFKYNGTNPNLVTINGIEYNTLQSALTAWVNFNSSSNPSYLKWLTYATKMPVLSPWSGEISTGYANGGDGSETNPYKIATAEQLAHFAEAINAGETANKFYELSNNIKLNNTMFLSDWVNYSLSESEYILNEWTPVGNETHPFLGTFNGNGYLISGIYVSNANSSYSGLFGYNSGTIKNLTLVNSFILGGQFSAGITGFNSGTIAGCFNSATVLADTSSGGIAGINTGTIRNSVNKGNITGVSTADNIGGIAGNNYGFSLSAVIENCYNHGIITSSVANTCVGGIAGQSYGTYSKILNTYNAGEIIANGIKFGGVAGYSNNSDIRYSYYFETSAGKCVGSVATSTVPVSCSSFDEEGTLLTVITVGGKPATSSVTQALNDWVSVYNAGQGTYTGWGGATFLPMLALSKKAVAHEISGTPKPIVWSGGAATEFSGGNGSNIDPYQISTAEQLKYFSDLINVQNPDYFEANYILTKDIFLNDSAAFITWTQNMSGLNLWTPIGNAGSPFCGNFDGNGHAIYGLYISNNLEVQGLFGKNSGTVINLNVTQSFVSAFSKVGLIAGENSGTVKNSRAYGNISGLGNNTGGLVGINSGLLESSYFRGTLNLSSSVLNAGGIVGNNAIGGVLLTLHNSATIVADGTASGADLHNIGGISGYNAGILANCYNDGNLTVSGTGTAKYNVGGIAGLNDEEVTNCFNLGTVKSASAYTELGGIVGLNRKTLSNSVNIPDTHIASGGNSNCGRIEGGLPSNKTGISCYYQFDKYNVGKFSLWNSNNPVITASQLSVALNAWAISANNNNLTAPLKYYFWGVFSGATMPSMTRVTVKNVIFELNGGNFKLGFNPPPVYYQGISNNALPLRSNTEKADFSLKGWHLSPDLSDAVITHFSTSYTGNLIFYAEWTSELTLITFDKCEGTGGTDTVTATNGLPMPLVSDDETALAAPEKEGYTFKGYYSELNGAGTQYYTETMESAAAWDKSGVAEFTLYAFWELNTYTVFYPTDSLGFTVTCPSIANHGEAFNLTVSVNEHYRQSIPEITVDGGTSFISNTGVTDFVFSFTIPAEKVVNTLYIAVGNVTLDSFDVTLPTEEERRNIDDNELMYSITANVKTVYYAEYNFTIEFLGDYFYFETSPTVVLTTSSAATYTANGVRATEGETVIDTTWNYTVAEGVIAENFSISVSGMVKHVHAFDCTCNCGTHICTVCGRHVTLPGEHTPGAPATCTTAQICLECGEVLVEALGHLYADEHTCHDRVCLREGCVDHYKFNELTGEYDIPVPHIELASTEHVLSEPPTCEHAQTCVICGDIIAEALGHIMKAGTAISDIVAPTCTEQGYTIYYCQRDGCNHIEHKDFTDPSGHDWIEIKNETVLPTCTQEGFIKHECSRCHKIKEEVLPALNHMDLIEGSTILPTCTEEGYTMWYCPREGCDYFEKRNIVPPLGHNWKIVQTVNPDCTHDGYIEYQCLNCGEIKREILPATGHCPGPPADCTHDQVCTECGEILEHAHGHSFGEIVKVFATCTEQGYDMRVCSVCGKIEKFNFVEPLGHDYVKTAEVAATCLEDGYTEYTCSRCGEIKREILPALGHTPGAPADCTHDQICTECGEILEHAHGHDWEIATYDKPKTCKKCGATEGYPLTRIVDNNGLQEADLTANGQKQAEFLAKDINKNKELSVRFSGGSILIDKACLNDITTGSGFLIRAGSVEISSLSELEREIVGSKGIVYDVEISIGENLVNSFSGYITVTLPYTLKEGESGKNVKVWYLNSQENRLEEVTCSYSEETDTVAFKISHLSKYVIGYAADEVKGLLPLGGIIGIASAAAAIVVVIIIFVIIKRKKTFAPAGNREVKKIKAEKIKAEKIKVEKIKAEKVRKETNISFYSPSEKKETFITETSVNNNIPILEKEEIEEIKPVQKISQPEKRNIASAGIIQMKTPRPVPVKTVKAKEPEIKEESENKVNTENRRTMQLK